MSKDSPTVPAGLLSKVARFVRNPATNWGDLDGLSEGRDEVHSKQALQEMIERKRRNDFVRKREFEMLRKLRSKPQAVDQGYGGRPSFFQSSYSSKPDDRAGTLKKINEIEAQMSMHWWKSRHADGRDLQTTLPPEVSQTLRQGRKPTAPPSTAVASSVGAANPLTMNPQDAAFAKTEADAGVQKKAGEAVSAKLQPTAQRENEEQPESSGFSSANLFVLDAQELALNPEIEEASIRFASGDDAATEQGLLETLKSRAGGGSLDEWMTLFDFYRATGQVHVFDSKAIDFASQFSRSAPQWFSIPEAVAERMDKTAIPSSQLDRATWVADADLDAHAILLLTKALERSPQPWVLDWSGLRSILPAAIDPLYKLMSSWAESDVDIRFLGEKNLRDVLQGMTVSGDHSVDQRVWNLRLAFLRVMDMGDEFELAALDFCITYELSPPSWASPRCRFKALQTGGRSAPGGSARNTQFAVTQFADSVPPDQGPASLSGFSAAGADSMMSGFSLQPAENAMQFELLGELIGDPQAELARLDEQIAQLSMSMCDISCRYLIRVDFSAAGSILNWVSAHQAAGRSIRFVNVPRLVATFFHVIGITEYAQVLTSEN